VSGTQARFYRNFVFGRIHAKDLHFARCWFEQIQEAFDGGGLAGTIAAEEAVAASSLNREIEAIHRVGLAVGAVEIRD